MISVSPSNKLKVLHTVPAASAAMPAGTAVIIAVNAGWESQGNHKLCDAAEEVAAQAADMRCWSAKANKAPDLD